MTRIYYVFACVWACIACVLEAPAQSGFPHFSASTTTNVYRYQEEALHHYRGFTNLKSTGYKALMRSLHYQLFRADENGLPPSPGKTLQEMQRYFQAHPNTKNYSSSDGNWVELGPFSPPDNSTSRPNGAGRINCLTFHPQNPNIIFAGAPSGGFWKTTDGGLHWERKMNGLVRLGVSSIVIHPQNPNLIYIGTGDRDGGDAPGYGVWRSTDGGENWHEWNKSMGYVTVNEILMHPNNPSILIATTNNSIYRSVDGGENWTMQLEAFDCKDIAFHPTNPNIVYASGNAFFRSTDNGISYQRITTNLPAYASVSRMAIAVSAHQPNWVYVVAGSPTGLVGVYRSTDAGQTFALRSSTPNILGFDVNGHDTKSQSWYDLALLADPANANILYVGGVNTWKSVDGGTSWTILTHGAGHNNKPKIHSDIHDIILSPHTRYMYLATDGGIHYTTDSGQSWMDISDGLAIAQVYKLGVSPFQPTRVIIGKQDNGSAIYDGKEEWTTRIEGDGMEGQFDYTDENVVYGSSNDGHLMRSMNGGTNFVTIARTGVNGITETGAWVTPFQLHPTDPNILYAGYENMWITKNVKATQPAQIQWIKISNWTDGYNVTNFAVANSNPNVVYVSRFGSQRFYKTTNALSPSPSWTDLTSRLPLFVYPKDIEIDPRNANHLWIALGNKIFESHDGGFNWTDISGSLPAISLNTIAFDRDSPNDALYIGMDAGVYYRDRTLNDWVLFSRGLPNVEITELEILQSSENCQSRLYAATYGCGLWATDLRNPGGELPKACFTTSARTICTGQIVRLQDQSSFAPTAWQWTISPASYTFVNGTSRSSQFPEVQFLASASYSISLTVSNEHGSVSTSLQNQVTSYSDFSPTQFNINFDNLPNCSVETDCGKTSCTISDFWRNLTNGVDDQIDWRVHSGPTPSPNTGPLGDYNSPNGAGRYIYLEASGDCYDKTGILESTCIALPQPYSLYFAYNMNGADMGTLHVDIHAGEDWIKDYILPINTKDKDWRTAVVNLAAFTGKTIRIRLRATTGNGFNSDIALDDIRFVQNEQATLATTVVDLSGTYVSGKGNYLQWKTTSNEIGEAFIIQRLNPLHKTWDDLDNLPVSTTENYAITDEHPFVGSNFYRIIIAKQETTLLTTPPLEITVPPASEQLNVYPNPVSDKLFLDITASKQTQLLVVITNTLGAIVWEKAVEVSNGKTTIPLAVKTWNAGIYFAKVGEEVFKIVKE